MPSKIDIEQRSISERDVEGAKETTFQSTVVFELDMKGRCRFKIVEIVFAEGPQLKLSNENQADEAKRIGVRDRSPASLEADELGSCLAAPVQ